MTQTITTSATFTWFIDASTTPEELNRHIGKLFLAVRDIAQDDAIPLTGVDFQTVDASDLVGAV